MASGRRGPIPDELGWLIDALDDYAERLRTLEAPSGEALSNTVAKLQALVTDIQAQLDAYMAGKYTNAQIDALVNNGDNAVAAQIQPAINSTLGGSVTIGGNLTVNGQARVPDAYNTDITWTRRTSWVGNDGRLGYASSSADKKTAITPADIDPAAVLELEPREFYYREEIRRRTRLRINEGVDYTPAREVGLLAHELDELGLGWLVYHDEDGHAEGIEYSMLTVALLAVARDQERRLRALEDGAS